MRLLSAWCARIADTNECAKKQQHEGSWAPFVVLKKLIGVGALVLHKPPRDFGARRTVRAQRRA